MTRSVDVVMLTALDLEYAAVRAHLAEVSTYADTNGTRYETGETGRCRIALALTGPGNLAAATLTTRAVDLFQPMALVFVGVAGGLAHDVALGDVVVATRVHDYQGGKAAAGEFLARPSSWPLAHALEQSARDVARAGAWAPTVPAVHFKPIVSGDVVLDTRDGPLAAIIARHYNDAVAIDMESAGVAAAAHHNDFHRVLTVRAISDLADGTKQDTEAVGWQQRAVTHAAAFAVAVAERIAADADDLAKQGANAVVGTMATDAFPAARVGLTRMFSRLGEDRERTAVTQLDADADVVADAKSVERDEVRAELAPGWRHRLARLLRDAPDAASDLRGLLAELPQERWVQTVVAHDQSTVYAAQGGNVIHYHADGPT